MYIHTWDWVSFRFTDYLYVLEMVLCPHSFFDWLALIYPGVDWISWLLIISWMSVLLIFPFMICIYTLFAMNFVTFLNVVELLIFGGTHMLVLFIRNSPKSTLWISTRLPTKTLDTLSFTFKHLINLWFILFYAHEERFKFIIHCRGKPLTLE